MDTADVVSRLQAIGAIRTGEFTLRSGRTSPLYFDLRRLVADPALLIDLARAYAGVARSLNFDVLAALPFAGLPIGVALSLDLGLPLVYPRPAKSYGTGASVEGVYESGQTALVVDDVITDGGAKLEGIASLRAAGLQVRDVVVFLDREEGGAPALASQGCALHAVTTMTMIIEAIEERGG